MLNAHVERCQFSKIRVRCMCNKTVYRQSKSQSTKNATFAVQRTQRQYVDGHMLMEIATIRIRDVHKT